MTRDEELADLLTTAFAREVAAMEIDITAGARRLQTELAAAERRQRRVRLRVLAAAVLVAVALLGWWVAWQGDDRAMPAAPRPSATIPQMPVQSQRAESRPPDDRPYLLDLGNGAKTPLPRRLLGEGHGWPVYAVRPGTREVALATCLMPGYGCLGSGSITMASLDEATVAAIPIPEGLVPQGVEVSPDGTRLLYPATDGSSYAVPEYYVYDRSTSHTRRLTDIPLESATWFSLLSTFSSDGRTVLFDLPWGDSQLTRWDVWSVPVDGGPATRVLRDAKGPRAIPGTSDLAVLTPKPSAWEGSAIEIVSASGTRRTLVESESGIGAIQASPDGRSLAYTEDVTGAWVIDIVTGRRTHVADGGAGPWVDADTLIILP